MITVIGGFLSCILWAIVAVLLFGALLWVLRACLDLRYTVASAVVAAVCAVGVFWESAQMAGCLHVKSYVADVSRAVESIAAETGYAAADIDIDELTQHLPAGLDGLSGVAGACDIDITGGAQAFITSADEALSSFLWARVAWLAGFVIVGTAAFVLLCRRGLSIDLTDTGMTDLDIY